MPSQSLEIRAATPQDIAETHRIYAHYVKTSLATLQETPPILADSASTFTRLTDLGMPYIVAIDNEDGNRIAGFAYADYFNDRSGYRHTVEDTIYMHPEYCGKGVGKLLFAELLQKLKDGGKKVVVAKMSILPDQRADQNASCRLHAAFGFEEVGRLKKVGHKMGTTVDVIIFQLDL